MRLYACTIIRGSAIFSGPCLLRMRTQVFTLPECASLSFGQLFLPPSTPLHIFSSYCKIMNEVGKGFSYSTIVLSTGPLLRLWVAPRLTDYHTLSPHPQHGLQCPPKVSHRTTVTLPSRISQPKFTLLLCRV